MRALRDVLLIDDIHDSNLWDATDSAANLAASPLHVLGSNGLSFDKIAGTLDAGVSRLLTPLNASARFSTSDFVELVLFTPASTGAADVILRLGTDAANYAEWIFSGALMNDAEWNRLTAQIVAQNAVAQVGTGLDLRSIEFVQVIIRMNAVGKTFVGAVLDSVLIRGDGDA